MTVCTCGTNLTPCLFILFSASLKQGIIPTDWKKATVSPIFKKGSRSDPANYRAISLTSLLCKTLEHIIYSHVMGHLERNNILSTNQFGFRQKRSADLQLLLTVHDLASSLNDNAQTDCILLDFSKAFDKVSHKLLLLKLRYYGITGETINWIQSFLTTVNSKLFVMVLFQKLSMLPVEYLRVLYSAPYCSLFL